VLFEKLLSPLDGILSPITKKINFLKLKKLNYYFQNYTISFVTLIPIKHKYIIKLTQFFFRYEANRALYLKSTR
jgi:hypothetical protein